MLSRKFCDVSIVWGTNLATPDAFVKVTNHTGLWDTDLTWYSLRAARRFCRGFHGLIKIGKQHYDRPYWTASCRSRLIISQRCSLILPRSWEWRTTLDYEMPISPDTLWVLLAGFSEVMKVTNRFALWDADFAWYSPSTTRRFLPR